MSLKLGYWPIGGITQPIRMLLHVLGQDYENIIHKNREEWKPIKKKMTREGANLLNLPYLIDGDTIITETLAIPFYLCQKFNRTDLLGKTTLDATRLLQYDSAFTDYHRAVVVPLFSENPKEGLAAAFKKGRRASFYMSNMASILGEKEFLTGYLTYQDLKLAYNVHFYWSACMSLGIEDNPFRNNPHLLRHAKGVFELEEMKGFEQVAGRYPPIGPETSPWFKVHLLQSEF